jgi:hypothetical protein
MVKQRAGLSLAGGVVADEADGGAGAAVVVIVAEFG